MHTSPTLEQRKKERDHARTHALTSKTHTHARAHTITHGTHARTHEHTRTRASTHARTYVSMLTSSYTLFTAMSPSEDTPITRLYNYFLSDAGDSE